MAFGDWLAKEDATVTEEERAEILEHATRCIQLLVDIAKVCDENETDMQDEIRKFIQVFHPIQVVMDKFTEHGCQCSETFVLWDNYVTDLSQLQLDHIAAKRHDKHK